MLSRMAKRSLHLGAVAGTAAHHGFELAAGVGLVFQPYLGLPGATAAWCVALPTWTWLALKGDGRHDRPLAVLAGVSLAGALLHFKMWPVGWRRLGGRLALPVLVEAEGLSPSQLSKYNAILYAWTGASLAALVGGTPKGRRRFALLGLAAGVPLSASARHHFDWLGVEARERPAWWNRAGLTASERDVVAGS